MMQDDGGDFRGLTSESPKIGQQRLRHRSACFVELSLDVAARSITGGINGGHQLLGSDAAALVEDAGLAGGEIDFDLTHAWKLAERALDRVFTTMAMHALDLNQDKMVGGRRLHGDFQHHEPTRTTVRRPEQF